MLEYLKQNKFLFRGSDKVNPQNELISKFDRFDDYTFPAKLNFFSCDTEEKFLKNLKEQPEDWKYRSKTVTYSFNKDGFRTRDFADIDFSNSIFLFGCSEAMGIGLDESETISFHLEKKLGVPVINLARNGTSMQYSFVNNLILKKICKKPLAVINHWTSLRRITFYNKTNCFNLLPQNLFFFKKYYSLLISQLKFDTDDISHHEEFQARLISDNCKLLWDNTRYVETSWHNKTADAIECKLIEKVDDARDLIFYDGKWECHSGCQTAEQLADFYASQLNL